MMEVFEHNIHPLTQTRSRLMATKQLATLFLLYLFNSLLLPVIAIPQGRWKSLSIIRKLNYNGPYLGLITTYAPEENAFFATGAFKPHSKYPYVDLSGRRFRVGKIDGKKVIYVKSGTGMVNAAAATQQMLDLFDIMGIVHFGIAGNANHSLSIGDVIIPKQVANTGLWDWLKPDASVPANDVAQLDFKSYNVPEKGNSLGRIGYSLEQFYSVTGEPNTYQKMLWFVMSKSWLGLASSLEGLKLEQCVNSTLCLPRKPKVVLGLRALTANIFVDNAAYRDFLFHTFQVSSVDTETSALVMTSLSNGFPVIVFRALSDLAGAQEGKNTIHLYGPLAASNVAKAVIEFVKLLPVDAPGVPIQSYNILIIL